MVLSRVFGPTYADHFLCFVHFTLFSTIVFFISPWRKSFVAKNALLTDILILHGHYQHSRECFMLVNQLLWEICTHFSFFLSGRNSHAIFSFLYIVTTVFDLNTSDLNAISLLPYLHTRVRHHFLISI